MEPSRPPEPQPGLPATRPAQPPAVPQPPPPWSAPPQQPAPGPRPRFGWRRFTRSPRGAAGLAIVVAALLLWPFAGWSWIPWLAGIGVVVLLRLLRLDKLLRDWDLHLAGLVVVAGLMLSSGPWSWALAASIGVLLAGLAQLPWWKLAAVGAVMCLVSGVGFGITQYQEEQKAVEQQKQTQAESKAAQGAPRPQGVLPTILGRVAAGSPGAICDNLLAEPARAPFAASVEQPDCAAAVGALSAQVTDRVRYERGQAPSTPVQGGVQVDACKMTWGSGGPAGPQLGHLTIGQIGPSSYVVTAFTPC
jgi:hypothetical protein